VSTFVSLGTSREPFLRLLNAVEGLAAEGRIPLPVVVQSGHTSFESDACVVRPFLPMDEFEDAVKQAALVICQAGGGTVILARLHGKVPVVVPRLPDLGEVIDSHQVANARALDQAGQAVAVMDMMALAEGVSRAMSLQASGAGPGGESKLVAAIREDLLAWEAGR
jgi:UDP-N-acetylglucosamine transferase subunit ALG13